MANPKPNTSGLKRTAGPGRRKGVQDRRTQLLAALKAEGASERQIYQQVIKLALNGDAQCLRMLMDRLYPVRKASFAPVKFSIDVEASPTESAQSILSAIASGAVPPDVGLQLMINGIASCMKILEVDELERRVEAVEGAK